MATCPSQVSRLLLLAGASPSHVSDYLTGAPLTGVFASQGYHDMVALLIEFGADVDAANAHGVTSLMFASKQGHLDVVRLLLSRGGTCSILPCHVLFSPFWRMKRNCCGYG